MLGNWSSAGFSFLNGLGGDMAGNIGYYLLSPLNFIVFLFPASKMNIAVYIIILIKLGLMSGTFTWLTLKWFKFKYQAYPVFLGIAYGLSGYSIAYAGNVMWFSLTSVNFLCIDQRNQEECLAGLQYFTSMCYHF